MTALKADKFKDMRLDGLQVRHVIYTLFTRVYMLSTSNISLIVKRRKFKAEQNP